MDAQKTIQEINEWKEYLGSGLIDSEYIHGWRVSTAHRMNYWAARVKIIEERFERIGIPVPEDDWEHQMCNKEFDSAYDMWTEAVGRVEALRKLRQLEGDLLAYNEAVAMAVANGKDQLNLFP